MSRRRYRRAHPFRSFVLTLILVLAAGAAVLWFAGPLKHQAAKAVGTKEPANTPAQPAGAGMGY